MTWFTQPANETQAGLDHYTFFLAVDFNFPSGHLRLWSGIGDLALNGNTYIGSGELGRISYPVERSALSFDAKTYELSGVDPALASESDIENCFGRSVTEYFGFLNTETRQVIADPEINFEGRMDLVQREDGATPKISVNAEHRLVLLDKADDLCYTDEHQQSIFAGDLGFDQVPSLELKEVIWAGERVSAGVSGIGHTRGGQPVVVR